MKIMYMYMYAYNGIKKLFIIAVQLYRPRNENGNADSNLLCLPT